MRFAARVLVASIFVIGCRGVVAAESGSTWWPFGGQANAAAAPTGAAIQNTLPPAASAFPQTNAATPDAGPVAHEVQMPTNADTGSNSHWMVNTPKKKISWPKLEWPKSLSSKAPAPKGETKNRWVEKAPAPKTSPMQSVKKGAHSVATTTKSAWNKTLAAVTPKSSVNKASVRPDPKLTARQTSPPFWKKMMGAKEPELQQPQTVPQWMAQKRIDP
jgi:hypothetical protein